MTLFEWPASRREQPTVETNPARVALLQQLHTIETLAFRVLLFIAIFIVIYSFAQSAGAFLSRDAFKTLGVLLGVTIAAVAVGGFLGFLFGIPRILQQARTTTPALPAAAPAVDQDASTNNGSQPSNATRRFLASNTNLEEISDWLTKIIVGIGLVQAGNIVTKVQSAAQLFKTDALPQAVGADIVFVLILLSAAIIGFLFFYMETRTRITLLFADIEMAAEPQFGNFEPKILNAVLQAPISSGLTDIRTRTSDTPVRAAPAPISEDKKILDIPYENLKTTEQLAAWASAQARANNFSAAIRALQDAIAKEPNDRDLLLRLADIQERRGNARAVYDLVNEARHKSQDPAILKRELLASLYLNPPESFQKAIPIADELARNADAAKDPLVWVWTAAAQGQRFRWLSENNGDDAQRRDARDRAFGAIQRVISLAPVPSSYPRTLLRQLFDPEHEKSPADENDLEIFKTDEQMRKLIYPDG
jgi:hypothetical protein